MISRNAIMKKTDVNPLTIWLLRFLQMGGGNVQVHTGHRIVATVCIAEVCRQKVTHIPSHSDSINKGNKNFYTVCGGK